MRQKHRKNAHTPARIALSICAALALGACSLWPGSENTHYTIATASDDEELRKYLSTILDDRLTEKLRKTEDDAERDRLETYREETIRADLAKALRAQGYYEGTVTYVDGDAPLRGEYRVRTGPDYRISSVGVVPKSYARALDGIKAGDRLNARHVLEAQARLYQEVNKDNCFLTLSVDNSVKLNARKNTGAVIFTVAAGPEADFGAATFKGQESVKDSYLQKLVPWQRGDCYRADKLETLRTRLMETGLFTQVDATAAARPDAKGQAPVTVRLKERAAKSVSAGLSYYTDEGPGVKLGWEHRNLFGAAEKLKAALSMTQLKQDLSTDLSKPFFLRDDQTLGLSASLGRQDTDAYEERGLTLGGKVSRTLTPRLSASLGGEYQLTENRERGEKNLFGLVSVPATLTYDSRNDKLDARRGWLLTGVAAPFFDTLGQGDPFVKLQAGARTYIDIGTSRDIVWALRGNVGSIMGAGTFSLPATQRFYAGGSESVRGFGYQEVGPRDIEGDPTGGRSLVAASSEVRFRITGDVGGVLFADAGSVSQYAEPDFKDFSIGAGAGIRYYTDFGPLRLDVAVPVNNKDDADRGFQFYVSIGQAF